MEHDVEPLVRRQVEDGFDYFGAEVENLMPSQPAVARQFTVVTRHDSQTLRTIGDIDSSVINNHNQIGHPHIVLSCQLIANVFADPSVIVGGIDGAGVVVFDHVSSDAAGAN